MSSPRADAQDVDPTRIQTPDLAFAEPVLRLFSDWANARSADGIELSIVSPESAANVLLDDARSGGGQYSAAFVPNWLLSDLVRDDFIEPASPPPTPIPRSVAQLRSFGGEWVATDLDHDCDLLYFRTDLLDRHGLSVATTWDELERQATLLFDRIDGGVATPQTHAQQAVDHFASMAALFAMLDSDPAGFWFDPESMQPSIASEPYAIALDQWRTLARTTPEAVRSGSTGDLWRAFLDGKTGYLIGSADFLPFALQSGIDRATIGISELPGITGNDGGLWRVGNTTGASWGGVIMRSASKQGMTGARAFFDHLAMPGSQTALSTDVSSGITPAPGDASTIDAFATAGWPEEPTSAWLAAIGNTLDNPLQVPPLRIAETRRYLRALEDRIVPLLASDAAPAAALSAAAGDWNEINQAIGVETQRDLYARSLMPPPGPESGHRS